MSFWRTVLFVATTAGIAVGVAPPAASLRDVPADVTLRGRTQTLHLYGVRGGLPVIVSSGDGGWIHVGPDVAALLAAHGYFVVGFDTRAYLESFTTAGATLRSEEEPGDYRALVEFAAAGTAQKPVLVGVSEGAGLSVLAAADTRLQPTLAGVVAIGLPPVAELGWRWRDAIIYVTHRVPNEPTFSVADVIDRVAPLPLAEIHSTVDEFVSAEEAARVMARAREPKRVWTVAASDHRFSGNRDDFNARLLDAIDWVRTHPVR